MTPDLTAIGNALAQRARTCPRCGGPAEASAPQPDHSALSRCPICGPTKLVARSLTRLSGARIKTAQGLTWDGSCWVATPIRVVEDL